MKRSWQIFWHIFLWVLLVGFFVLVAHNSNKLDTEDLLVLVLLYGIINISVFYLNYLVLIPLFLNTKKYGIYAAAIVGALIVYGLAKYGVAFIFKQIVLMRVKGQAISFGHYFIGTVFTSLVFLVLSAVLKFTVDWFLNERKQRDLENQRLSAELAFLKSQINPHFLFNSLNSIYSLAYQRSETTPDAILKLSEIMRYMLYESNDNKVDLEKELQYLHSYIDLQKIRFGNKAYIDFKVQGNIGNQQIAPLLLIAFIENAFKHGVANNPLTPIRVLIDVDDAHLHFYMQNKKHMNNRDTLGGIGLNNVQRRLNLLYPGKYNLVVNDETDTYTVELSLVL
ncbi:MAG TPA: sensor histidine kinase [Mucilaginibacter sp.]|jgi:two-component sensor histidine kinase|nr:sensor histidine kinase [Mucilaginibacter sp.]